MKDKEQVASIIDSIFPDVNLRDPKSVIPVETAAYFNPALCEGCPGFDDCKEYMDSASHVKTADEHVDEDDDERLILVSTDTMDDMLEDMCSLGMVVDDLLDIFYTLMDGGDISSDDLMERMYHAEDTSEEVYAKCPSTAQQTITYQNMYKDGICRVTEHFFTKTVVFGDINYQLALNEDKTAAFEFWCDFYNYFDSSISLQISCMSQYANLAEMEKVLLLPVALST